MLSVNPIDSRIEKDTVEKSQQQDIFHCVCLSRCARINRLIILMLCAFAIGASTRLKSAETPAKKSVKYGPNDVDVRFRDGTNLRGQIQGVEAFTLKTSFGTLTIPIRDMLRLQAGNHAPQNAKKIETAGKDSNHDDKDTITSSKFEARGILQMDSMILKSKVGELHLKPEDIDSIRWLARGSMKSLKLDAGTAVQDWIDTGLDGVPGDTISVAVSGAITMFNTSISPLGNASWNTQPFAIGAVIGKFGSNGEPFLIGKSGRWPTPTTERLYVKIFCSEEWQQRNNLVPAGSFMLQIASGSWIDEIPQEAPDAKQAIGDDDGT